MARDVRRRYASAPILVVRTSSNSNRLITRRDARNSMVRSNGSMINHSIIDTACYSFIHCDYELVSQPALYLVFSSLFCAVVTYVSPKVSPKIRVLSIPDTAPRLPHRILIQTVPASQCSSKGTDSLKQISDYEANVQAIPSCANRAITW